MSRQTEQRYETELADRKAARQVESEPNGVEMDRLWSQKSDIMKTSQKAKDKYRRKHEEEDGEAGGGSF